MAARKYHVGDRFYSETKTVEIVATQTYGHTTGLTLRITEASGEVSESETNSHRFTRLRVKEKLRRNL